MAIDQQIIFNGEKGVLLIGSRPTTIHEALEASELTARTAAAIRLLHQAAKQSSGEITAPQPYGTNEVFICACGQQFHDRWDAIAHVEKDHASSAIRQDLDALEATIEALVVPSPLTDWDALATGTVTQEQLDAASEKSK